jgi:hypothetical protein
MSYLYIVNSEIAVGNVLDLIKCLVLSSDFDRIFPIDEEISIA